VNVRVEELDEVDEVTITESSDLADARSGLNGNQERRAEAGRPPRGRPVT
jgi:hypothetical protein